MSIYRPVTRRCGRFASLTPEIDREVNAIMDRLSAVLTRIAKRDALIAKLESDNRKDRQAVEVDRDTCFELEAQKAAFSAGVMAGAIIPVDFRPHKQNKPPKKAA